MKKTTIKISDSSYRLIVRKTLASWGAFCFFTGCIFGIAALYSVEGSGSLSTGGLTECQNTYFRF